MSSEALEAYKAVLKEYCQTISPYTKEHLSKELESLSQEIKGRRDEAILTKISKVCQKTPELNEIDDLPVPRKEIVWEMNNALNTIARLSKKKKEGEVEEKVTLGGKAVLVEFDYDPPEPGSWNKPACSAEYHLACIDGIDINAFKEEVKENIIKQLKRSK